MTGNVYTYTSYIKNGDDLGMVYGIVLPTLKTTRSLMVTSHGFEGH
jgi:hypothetical protein